MGLKRLGDIIASVLLLVLAGPMLVLLVPLLWADVGPPALFRQQRPGLRGRPFTLLKLRTMVDRLGPDGTPEPDARRLTRLGRLLRALSVDELPQLWNVLRGEMSMVGPRPLLMEYLPLYTPGQMRRHDVRPGLTGWAQVRGRNELSWDEKFALDTWYVDHWSLGLDLRILLLTAVKVARREGVSQGGHATVPKFTGVHGQAPTRGVGNE